jgi:hypothetical protein
MSRALTTIAALKRLNIIEKKINSIQNFTEKANDSNISTIAINNDSKTHAIQICIHFLGCDVIGEGSTAKETYRIFRPLLSGLSEAFNNYNVEVTLLLNGINFNMEEKYVNIMKEDIGEEKTGVENVTLVYCPGMYHESTLAQSYPPDILLAFNAGLWGYDDWVPTLNYILLDSTSQLNAIPLIITSYNKLEAEDDEDVLLRILKCDTGEEDEKVSNYDFCLWGAEKNLHPDEHSRRPSTHEGEFLTDNSYWMCFVGKSNG